VILDKLTGLVAELEVMNAKFDIEKIDQAHKIYDQIIGLSAS